MTSQEYLLKKIEEGYTVKKDSNFCYKVFRSEKLYLLFYNGKWCEAETSNYRLAKFDLSMPKPINP